MRELKLNFVTNSTLDSIQKRSMLRFVVVAAATVAMAAANTQQYHPNQNQRHADPRSGGFG